MSDLAVRLTTREELLSAALGLTVQDATKLLEEAGTAWNILKRPDLQHKYGIMNGTLAAFSATMELAGRSRTELDTRPVITAKTGSKDLAEMMARMNGLIHEEAWVAYIAADGHLLDLEMVARGDEDSTTISPGIVARKCILSGASAVALIHNHPQGEVGPSGMDPIAMMMGGGDIAAFTAMYGLLKALRIKLWDCLIIGSGTYWSGRETGVLDEWVKQSEEEIEKKREENRAKHVPHGKQAADIADLLKGLGAI